MSFRSLLFATLLGTSKCLYPREYFAKFLIFIRLAVAGLTLATAEEAPTPLNVCAGERYVLGLPSHNSRSGIRDVVDLWTPKSDKLSHTSRAVSLA